MPSSTWSSGTWVKFSLAWFSRKTPSVQQACPGRKATRFSAARAAKAPIGKGSGRPAIRIARALWQAEIPLPHEVTISVGRARPLVRDLLRLSKDAVLQLDRRVDDPVELYVGDRLIARGELTELEGENAGQLAVRLTAGPPEPTR